MLPISCVMDRKVLAIKKIIDYLVIIFLFVVSVSGLYAQPLPEDYEIEPVGGGLNGAVRALHVNGEDIYYGGNFNQAFNALDGITQIHPVAHTRSIARWDGTQWYPLGQGTNGEVLAIASSYDGSIYVAGNFTQVIQSDGEVLPVDNIARFYKGHWSALGNGLNSDVLTLAVVETGHGHHELYAGGQFHHSGRTEVTSFVKWDGEQWHAVGAGLGGIVTVIKYSKIHAGLYVGGNFVKMVPVSGQTALSLNHIGFWSIANQQWQAMGAGAGGSQVTAVEESADGQTVYASALGVGLTQFNWTQQQWRTLSSEVFGMQLLPDQQRIIGVGAVNDSHGLMLATLETSGTVQRQLLFQQEGMATNQVHALHHSGVYAGLINNIQPLYYTARLLVPDMDGDTLANNDDNCPLQANADQTDTDQDGAGNACDLCPADALNNCLANPKGDFDRDSVINAQDRFPADSSEWADEDNDGVGDNTDNCLWSANHDQADFDQDGIGDVCDIDRDGDGFNNDRDVFPDDPLEWADDDSDGIGNNADFCPRDDSNNCLDNPSGDFDGDGVANGLDRFPENDAEWADDDEDGTGNNQDICPQDEQDKCLENPHGDYDNDGVSNQDDRFPTDSNEWADDDNDGIGDNADLCLGDAQNNCLNNPNGDFDGDGVVNSRDKYPEDSTRWSDLNDQDGRCIRPNV